MKAIIGHDDDGYPTIILIPNTDERAQLKEITDQLDTDTATFDVTIYTELNKSIYGITTDPNGCVLELDGKQPVMEIRLFEAGSILDKITPKGDA